MGNASSSNKISAQDRAILDLKNQRDKLQQYQKRISKLTDLETSVARECLKRGQRPKAQLALRRKKYQESLLSQTDAQLEQLQKLTDDIEFAAVQKDVMFGLSQGTAVLKQIHAEMGGIENVEKLLGENEEARAYEREISQLLGGQLSNADEDEVEDELRVLDTEVHGTKAPEERLPDVPTGEVASDVAERYEQQRPAKASQRTRESSEIAMEPLPA